jgi:hypothetical protein
MVIEKFIVIGIDRRKSKCLKNAIAVSANWRKRTLLLKKARLYVRIAISKAITESRHVTPGRYVPKKIFREEAGLEGTQGLTDLQKAIYEFIVSSGGVKKEEISKKLGISQTKFVIQ